jgi:hypothetical protein
MIFAEIPVKELRMLVRYGKLDKVNLEASCPRIDVMVLPHSILFFVEVDDKTYDEFKDSVCGCGCVDIEEFSTGDLCLDPGGHELSFCVGIGKQIASDMVGYNIRW